MAALHGLLIKAHGNFKHSAFKEAYETDGSDILQSIMKY